MPKRSPRVKYSRETIFEALDAVDRQEMSMLKASKHFGVPRSTLKMYYSDRTRRGKCGPESTFTAAEEQLVLDWARDLHRKGFIVRKSDLQQAALCILEDNPRKSKIKDFTKSKSWFRGYEHRNPQIVNYIQPEYEEPPNFGKQQCYEDVFMHLDCLEPVQNPGRVFKYNEMTFGWCSNIAKYFEGCNEASDIKKDLITTALITSARGRLAFPMIVYPANETISLDLAATVPLFYGWGSSPSGMMTKEMFYKFVIRDFYKYLILNKVKFPVVLFIDGIKPNISLDLWQACKKLEICLVAYNPIESRNGHKYVLEKTNLTHHLMRKLGEGFSRWKEINSGSHFSEEYFAELLQAAVNEGASEELILKDWKEFGFYQWLLKRSLRIKDIEFVCTVEGGTAAHNST